MRASCFVLALLLSAVGGCNKKPEASPPLAFYGIVVPPLLICPLEASGAGTAGEPCVGTDRALEAKWTGKNKKASVFSVTNKLMWPVDFVQASAYYYDAAGKQIEVPLSWNSKYRAKSWDGSVGLVMIQPSETKEVELGYDVDSIPKATKTIEIEFSKVGFKVSGSTSESYWQNDSLAPSDRPMGGSK